MRKVTSHKAIKTKSDALFFLAYKRQQAWGKLSDAEICALLPFFDVRKRVPQSYAKNGGINESSIS